MKGEPVDALRYFERALELNFEGHEVIYEYLPELRNNEKILNLINTYDTKK
jgi:hypothetical protein